MVGPINRDKIKIPKAMTKFIFDIALIPFSIPLTAVQITITVMTNIIIN